ncbi:hypothetical protein KY285_033622 [Solanum tuberosum]|nr:hypothetical protein KY285_033622 [Solanum tuberosum]
MATRSTIRSSNLTISMRTTKISYHWTEYAPGAIAGIGLTHSVDLNYKLNFYSVKIGVHDTTYNVFINFTNDDDFNLVWYKRVVEIEGLKMWLQKRSPDYKPEEDISIALVWIT